MSSNIPQVPGIYIITCTINGKIYIGSSINILKRWSDHRSALRAYRHNNPHLQRAWNKYGESAFTFEVLELVMPWSLLDREQYWLDKLKPYQRKVGYNIGIKAIGGMVGRKHTPEALTKMSSQQKGKKQKSETIEKRRISNTGKKRSPEFRARLSAANKGKKHSPEALAKMSAAKLGKKLSPEIYEQQAESRRKTYIFTSPEGVEIIAKGLAKFCREHGLLSGSMSEVASGKRRQYKGWKCRLAEV